MYCTLIQPAQLAASRNDPLYAIIDCRFDLADPARGEREYLEAHLPRAVYAHLDRDLSSKVTADTGRHPLPERAAFAATLGRWGVDAGVQVVAYDQGNGAYAARLWWMLRWHGHQAVAVLDGGFAAWQSQQLPTTSAVEQRAGRRFVSRAPLAEAVTTVQLQDALRTGTQALIDARGADRFAGRNETIDPVAGHVPGARNHPFAENLDAAGCFLSPAELHRRWQLTLGDISPESVVNMCGSGVTACHNLLAMEIAGLHGARLYGGSWSEWIRDPSRPIARSQT